MLNVHNSFMVNYVDIGARILWYWVIKSYLGQCRCGTSVCVRVPRPLLYMIWLYCFHTIYFLKKVFCFFSRLVEVLFIEGLLFGILCINAYHKVL